MLSWNEIRARCAAFAEHWSDASDEDADAKSFWDHLFTCYGANRRQVASFEAPVRMLNGNIGFIDLIWKGKLLVEHKSRGKDLNEARSQGLDYIERLKPHERPRWLVTSDFARFHIHDLHNGHEDSLLLTDLAARAELFGFLAGYEPKRPTSEAPVNLEAVARLGGLYDAMKAGGYPEDDLPMFLVRVLFCLFAEDTGVFGRDVFTDFITYRTQEDGSDLGPRLEQFFRVLDTPKDRRQRHTDELLTGLEYVNGALFTGHLAFAEMNSAMRTALLACTEFDWSRISPAIFGSLFQGVMDAAERRAIGAHYTAEDNILKVIGPLFLDALKAELAAILTGPERGREAKLEAFHNKLAALNFFDPACGCGNFLIITYREIRKLEIQVLKALHPHGQLVTDVSLLSKVRVSQFHGIEIEEFPAQIARVAMWLMDHIENVELGYAFGLSLTRLPLVESANIVCGNALQIDWQDVIAPEKCSFILGNPPFVGKQYMSDAQKEDLRRVWKNAPGTGTIDFVTAWHALAAEYMAQARHVRTAFVSTNSICQGEQAGLVWGRLLAPYGNKILFAHRTFAWQSEARGKAHVHCIIVGFGHPDSFVGQARRIFDYDLNPEHPVISEAKSISPYLVEANDSVATPRSRPLCDVSEMIYGSKPTDGGHLIIEDEDHAKFIEENPSCAKYVRPFRGSVEFINGRNRWCLWLHEANPIDIRSSPGVIARIEAVRAFRLASPKEATRKDAATPSLFAEPRQPSSDYLLVPSVSSERRRYIPIGFMDQSVVASNLVFVVPYADKWMFGILCSEMHMAWTRITCGRLKSDFRYSNKLVYNNYPWPQDATEASRAGVEKAAQAVLDARAQFPGSTLADLYDPVAMPPALAKAHAALDLAVDRCYRKEPFHTDRERVEYLFALYEKLAAPLAAPAKKPRKRKL
jgi:hypothetical protein